MHSSWMCTTSSSSCLLGWGWSGLGGVCLSACWDTPPRPGSGPPPGCESGPSWCGPGYPPPAIPPNIPLGLGLDTPQPDPQPPGCGPGRQVWAWNPPRCGPGYPQVWAWTPLQPDPSTSPLGLGLNTSPLPHVNRILETRFWKYYLAPTSLRVVII